MKKLNLSIRCCECIPLKCYKRAVMFHRGSPYCAKHWKSRAPKVFVPSVEKAYVKS